MIFKITTLRLLKNGEWILGNIDGLPDFENSFEAEEAIQQTLECYQAYEEYKDYRFDSFVFTGRYFKKE